MFYPKCSKAKTISFGGEMRGEYQRQLIAAYWTEKLHGTNAPSNLAEYTDQLGLVPEKQPRFL